MATVLFIVAVVLFVCVAAFTYRRTLEEREADQLSRDECWDNAFKNTERDQ